MKKLLITFAFVLVLLTALACDPSKAHQLEDPPEARWLSKVMVIEYGQNPVRFEYERVGSQIRTYGKIYRIQAGGSIIFSQGLFRSGRTLVCRFADPQELVNLSRGDAIAVTGVISHVKDPYEHESLHMTGCRLADE